MRAVLFGPPAPVHTIDYRNCLATKQRGEVHISGNWTSPLFFASPFLRQNGLEAVQGVESVRRQFAVRQRFAHLVARAILVTSGTVSVERPP